MNDWEWKDEGRLIDKYIQRARDGCASQSDIESIIANIGLLRHEKRRLLKIITELENQLQQIHERSAFTPLAGCYRN